MSDDFSDYNTMVLDNLDDTSPNQIVTRVAKRIVEKGFELTHITRARGHREGFNWGRSSSATVTKVHWEIGFNRPGSGDDHVVAVVVETTSYDKRNPYDRIPKAHNQPRVTIMATNPTKAILGWKSEQDDR